MKTTYNITITNKHLLLPPPTDPLCLYIDIQQYNITMSSSRIEYSEKYADEENEYRWVYMGKKK